jgi:hypothetical protein
MIRNSNDSIANSFALDDYLERVLGDSFRGAAQSHQFASIDIDTLSHQVEPVLREQACVGNDQYRIEFLLEIDGVQVKFGTGNVFPLNWIRAPLIAIEYVITYALAHKTNLLNGKVLSDEAIESMKKVSALFDGHDLFLAENEEYLHLANRFYDERPWFYRLSTAYEVI